MFNELMHLLDYINVDNKSLRLIQVLYYKQTATIRVQKEVKEAVTTKRSEKGLYALL